MPKATLHQNDQFQVIFLLANPQSSNQPSSECPTCCAHLEESSACQMRDRMRILGPKMQAGNGQMHLRVLRTFTTIFARKALIPALVQSLICRNGHAYLIPHAQQQKPPLSTIDGHLPETRTSERHTFHTDAHSQVITHTQNSIHLHVTHKSDDTHIKVTASCTHV